MKNYLTNWKSVIFTLLLVGILISSGCNQPAQQSSNEPNTAGVNWNNKVIYELNVRQFTPEGTFKAFEEHLPRLKELGVDIIWFMPIFPVGEKFNIILWSNAPGRIRTSNLLLRRQSIYPIDLRAQISIKSYHHCIQQMQ